MAAPEEENVWVVGDGPLVGDEEALVIDTRLKEVVDKKFS